MAMITTRNGAAAIEPELASTGTASTPVAMKPIEKTAEARGPAIGASALAASAAVLMVTGPFCPIVDDVATMMANIASVLTSIPTNTSIRERNSLVPAFRGLRSGSGFDASLVPDSERI